MRKRRWMKESSMGEKANNVINIWQAKQERDGRDNLAEFINFAKTELTLYNEQGWEADRWKPNKGQTLVFGFQEEGNNYSKVELFKQPYLNFVKAFIKQQMTIKEITSAHIWMSMFRFLYKALLSQYPDQAPCILNVNGQTLKETKILIEVEKYSPLRKYHIGGKLKSLADWLVNNNFVLTLPKYKNPFRKPAHTAEQVSEEGDKFREERCPTMHEMLTFADCFSKAETIADKYYTSALVLLCFAPARINELSGLTIHSLQEGDDGGWYIVWYGSKGFKDHRKGVPELMLDVVKKAFQTLKEISEPARKAAKWAYERPFEFFRHEGCITLKSHGESVQMSQQEFAYAMDVVGTLHHTNKEVINTPVKWINAFLAKNELTYERLNQLVHGKYQNKDWPNNPKSERPVWENLLLIRDLELKPGSSTKNFSWVMPKVDTFNNQISKKDKKMSTLWERFGVFNEDGSVISLTTHQFRVWLNTHCKRGGVDDWKIAQWSGRADIKQNSAYDLRTSKEKNELAKQLMVTNYKESPSALALRKANLPVPLKSLGINREGVADFSGIGFCTHDFAQTPCTKAGECVTCKEHVCMKGVPETLEELKHLEKLISEQYVTAQNAAGDSVFGADRWVTHFGWKLAHIRTLIHRMTDDQLDDGTIIRIPVEHDPSPTRRALGDKGLQSEFDAKKENQVSENAIGGATMGQLLGIC